VQTDQVLVTNISVVLSMAIAPSDEYYITSSADAILAKHPLPRERGIWNSEWKPLKVSQTKHSGQQGLQVRSDGKIFATAGWDARVRVYSAKTLKELAVLRWHKTGCYATAFAQIDTSPSVHEIEESDGETKAVGNGKMAAVKQSNVVQQKRDDKAQTTHWLAVGSKDGKVSLWDIY
jgi:ASTRA-associated protein 1